MSASLHNAINLPTLVHYIQIDLSHHNQPHRHFRHLHRHRHLYQRHRRHDHYCHHRHHNLDVGGNCTVSSTTRRSIIAAATCPCSCHDHDSGSS